MRKKIHVYSARWNSEIANGCREHHEHRSQLRIRRLRVIQLAQNRFSYYDEEVMTDPWFSPQVSDTWLLTCSTP